MFENVIFNNKKNITDVTIVKGKKNVIVKNVMRMMYAPQICSYIFLDTDNETTFVPALQVDKIIMNTKGVI